MDFPRTASGPMKPASQEDIERDHNGYTHPNLHRRIDTDNIQEGELVPRSYVIGVFDTTNSIRMTQLGDHDEESTTCEIP